MVRNNVEIVAINFRKVVNSCSQKIKNICSLILILTFKIYHSIQTIIFINFVRMVISMKTKFIIVLCLIPVLINASPSNCDSTLFNKLIDSSNETEITDSEFLSCMDLWVHAYCRIGHRPKSLSRDLEAEGGSNLLLSRR